MSLCGVESMCEVVIHWAFTKNIPKAIRNTWKHTTLVAEMACDRSSSTASRECRDPRMQEELKLPIAAPFRALLSFVLSIGCVPSVPSFRTVTGKSVYLSRGEGQWRSQNHNVKSSQLQVVYLAVLLQDKGHLRHCCVEMRLKEKRKKAVGSFCICATFRNYPATRSFLNGHPAEEEVQYRLQQLYNYIV